MRGDAPGVVFEARDEHPGAELPVELVADGRYGRGYRALEVELLQDVAAVLVLVDGPVPGLTAGDEGPEDLHEQVDALGLVRVEPAVLQEGGVVLRGVVEGLGAGALEGVEKPLRQEPGDRVAHAVLAPARGPREHHVHAEGRAVGHGVELGAKRREGLQSEQVALAHHPGAGGRVIDEPFQDAGLADQGADLLLARLRHELPGFVILALSLPSSPDLLDPPGAQGGQGVLDELLVHATVGSRRLRVLGTGAGLREGDVGRVGFVLRMLGRGDALERLTVRDEAQTKVVNLGPGTRR